MADMGLRYDMDTATKGMAEGNVKELEHLHDPGRMGTKVSSRGVRGVILHYHGFHIKQLGQKERCLSTQRECIAVSAGQVTSAPCVACMPGTCASWAYHTHRLALLPALTVFWRVCSTTVTVVVNHVRLECADSGGLLAPRKRARAHTRILPFAH
jgi:hypothetical protein